jgi:DNA-nicking Smr family endonuclease
MPRRRLHGRTQERRKKPRTRLLKRATTAVRVQSTQQPAPFERSPHVERDDLEFLEAMRELQVQRSPWGGESVARRQTVERVQFLAEDQEAALFRRSMEHMGVTPLSAPPAADPGGSDTIAEDPAGSATETEAGIAAVSEAVSETTAPPAGAEPVAGPARRAPSVPQGHGAAAAASAPSPGAAGGVAQPTEFEASEDAQALMQALLREGDFAPELKFAGAAAPARRRGERPPWENEQAEPDDELDLHGKTQEEAIHMVQAFLLTCQRQRLAHVLVITGQGRNSGPAGPVLKDAVYRWLELNGQRFARAFTRAPAHLGGDGAIWVTLR